MGGRSRGKLGMVIAVLFSAALMPAEAHGFWFYCTWRDGLRAGRVANAARANYYNRLANSNNQAEIQGAKMAWDQARNATVQEVKKLASEVPGTSLTGPTDAKDFAQQFLREAVKEALGEISSNPHEGLPSSGIGASPVVPEGAFFGSAVMDSIPVSLDLGQFMIDGIEVVTPATYDGSAGDPPADFASHNAVLVMTGHFFDVPMGDYEIVSALFGSAAYTLDDLEDDLMMMSPVGAPMGERAFLGGLFDEATLAEAAANIVGFDPAGVILSRQLTLITITGVDTEAGTISGTFFSASGAVPLFGDMNGDSVLDAFDVSPFELALADRQAYMMMFPGINPDEVGDFNADGEFDAFDVTGFEAALAGPGAAIPAPATVSIALLGLGVLAQARRR